MRSIVSLFIAGISISSAATAFADVTFSVDLDSSTAGIQSSINVVNGATISGTVQLLVTGTSRFGAYDAILDFEQANLAYGPNILSGLKDDGMGNRTMAVSTNRVNRGASGIISLVPVVVFDLGPLTDDEPLSDPMPDPDPLVNSFKGVAAQTSGTALGVVFNGDFDSPVYDFTLSAINLGTAMLTLRPGDPAFLDAVDLGVVSYLGGQVTITAVPEPSSLAVAGIGTVFVGRRIRRRRKSKREQPTAI